MSSKTMVYLSRLCYSLCFLWLLISALIVVLSITGYTWDIRNMQEFWFQVKEFFDLLKPLNYLFIIILYIPALIFYRLYKWLDQYKNIPD